MLELVYYESAVVAVEDGRLIPLVRRVLLFRLELRYIAMLSPDLCTNSEDAVKIGRGVIENGCKCRAPFK
jgi:hypothetical protein